MTEVSNVKVYDLKECMLASGYPMKVNVDDGESFENLDDRINIIDTFTPSDVPF